MDLGAIVDLRDNMRMSPPPMCVIKRAAATANPNEMVRRKRNQKGAPRPQQIDRILSDPQLIPNSPRPASNSIHLSHYGAL